MEEGSKVREEGCIRCKESSMMGSVAFFCTACGRKVKPVPEGKFAFRAAEGSAEKAWKSFGFADAHAQSKQAKSAMIGGSDSTKRAASLALAATRNNIERTVAPPTLEQARVMGVESVVEGIDWDLSTDQLQVLALARSGALRGRRRVPPSVLPQPSPATPKPSVTTKTAVPKRRAGKRRPRDGRDKSRRHESSVDRTYIGNEQQGQRFPTKRSPERRGSDGASKRHPPTEAAAPSKKEPKSSNTTSSEAASTSSLSPAASKKQRYRLEVEETKEQIVAVARGGVRYAGKVFHRRGVKLTEDSPRSMLPRDAFRASGLHLLGQKHISAGRNGHQQVFVSALSAVVRATPVDTTKAVGAVKETPIFRCTPRSSSQSPSSPHIPESSFVCDGVRLEMRPLRCCCQALHGERTIDPSRTASCLENSDQLPNVMEKIGAVAEETLAAFREEIGSSGSSGSSLELRKSRRRVEEDVSAHAGELLPQVASSLSSTSTAGRPDQQHDCSVASVDGRCHERIVPVVFSQDFTHVELDSLLGSTLRWKNPFEETRKTVGGLEASWIACLDSLCGRLRATVPGADVCGVDETDAGRLPGGGGEVTASEDDAIGALVAESPGTFPDSADGSGGRAEGPQREWCVEEGLASNADVGRQGSPAVQVAGGDTMKTGYPTGLSVAAGDDESHGRAAQALPLVRRRGRAGAQSEEKAEAAVWFDKTILRVGARVPWGRLQRGRFAKVLFVVSLGEGGNGLEFAATSNSPTADPMLRGRWDFRATDRDLARYLSSGHAAVTRAKNRRVKPHAYDPQRCTVEPQERGELAWACTVIARTAFRLVMVVPGGVVLSLAGVAIVGGREVAWPQDIEEDRELYKASSDIQRTWRGCTSRKRTRWLRLEREGRRRLSRMRKEVEDEREKTRLLEEEESIAKLALEEKRRTRAQVVMAAAARGQAARQEASRRRAEQTARQHQLEQAEADKEAARPSLSRMDNEAGEDNETAESEPTADDDHEDNTTTPGVARLERVVTIDGTAVHLTAHVKEAVDGDGDGGGNSQPLEMLLVAVDEKARRSSRLSLGAADIREMVGANQAGKGGNNMMKTLSAVLQKLTLFNSRRKDLFILSYRGKKVVAPH